MMRVRLLDHGRVLYGGSPPRFVKLTEAGRLQALSFFVSDHDHTAQTPASDRLRQRLVHAGILSPSRPGSGSPLPSVGFVIPHFNDPNGAATSVSMLLAAWQLMQNGVGPDAPVVVVVDDGSDGSAREELHRLLDPLAPTVAVLNRPVNGGPAAARNAGAAALNTDVIFFVDCGVSLEGDALNQLIGWFLDRTTAAAAPRVQPTGSGGIFLGYEERSSPLDVTRNTTNKPTLVGSDRQVTYVPSTVLAVRAEVFRNLGGFDESLRYGEDVDLIWRLGKAGRSVVLDPEVIAHHPARSTILEFAAQRFCYGTSAAPLGSRHGSAIAPAAIRPELAIATLAWLATPARFAGFAIVASFARDATRRSVEFSRMADNTPGVAALGAMESVRFNLACTVSVASAMSRTWWPVTALLILQPWSHRLRRRTADVVVARMVGRFRAVGAADLPLAVLDDLAYGAGVWWGALEEGRLTSLLPRLLRGR